MTRLLTLLATSSALVLSMPASAQTHAGHGGMTMPMPAAKKPVVMPAAKKPAVKKSTKQPAAASKKAVAKRTPTVTKPAKEEPAPIDHGAMDHGAVAPAAPATVEPIDHGAMGHVMPTPGETDSTAPHDMDAMDHAAMGNHAAMGDHAAMGHDGHGIAALGSYPAGREASGTAWQPDSSEHVGLHGEAGGWSLMLHGSLALTADTQGGPRGGEKLFVGGHFMGSARRQLGGGTLQLRSILSPEPLMGKRGFPVLLASGETANGRDRLIDRQHPHDFIGELSASYSHPIGGKNSVFVYGGLPGEPAFGPPAYLHREAIDDSPEPPITHHWLDSTHVSEGVVTAGLVLDRFKIEASRFNGREPNQHRWDIETGPLDSTSLRVSWNPVRTLALQASWARLKEPEQLEPGINQTRFTASALYAADLAPGWRLASTLAFGRRIQEGHGDNAYAIESALKHGSWTLFGRGEITENRELVDVEDAPAYRVGKASLGLMRDVQLVSHLALGIGGLLSVNFIPDGLSSLYGGHNPLGAMGFVRFTIE